MMDADRRHRRYAAVVVAGAVLLAAGAAAVDIGFLTGRPALERLGNLALVGTAPLLAFLPPALGVCSRAARSLYWAGTALASVVDIPAVLDPTDLRAGRLLGVPAMVLMSVGLWLMWRERRSPALLAGAIWFVVQLAPNALLFIGPYGRPSFVLQVIGLAVAFVAAARSRTPVPRTARAVTVTEDA